MEAEGAEERKGDVEGFFGDGDRWGGRIEDFVKETVYGSMNDTRWITVELEIRD